VGRFDFCDPSSHEKSAHLVSVDSVIVTEQIAGLLTKRHRFPQLLDHPGHRRMRRHSKMHNLATGMIQDHKNVQDLKEERVSRFSCPKIAGGGQASQLF
jgi:hypothetical protein